MTVHYKFRNLAVLVPSLLMIIFAVLILTAEWRSKWGGLSIGAWIFGVTLTLLAIVILLYGCKGLMMYLIGSTEALSLDDDRIIIRHHSVRWAEIQKIQLIHDSHDVRRSIDFLVNQTNGEVKRLIFPLWPGVSHAEIEELIGFIAKRTNRGKQ